MVHGRHDAVRPTDEAIERAANKIDGHWREAEENATRVVDEKSDLSLVGPGDEGRGRRRRGGRRVGHLCVEHGFHARVIPRTGILRGGWTNCPGETWTGSADCSRWRTRSPPRERRSPTTKN